MKKLYSKSSLVRTVTLGAAVATLLSSVSPVFAANLSITGELNRSTNGTDVFYPWGSHGSIVFAGDDDYCGVDNVVGRGGKQQQGIPNDSRISAEEQYNRFINNQEFNGRHPYGTTTNQEVWGADGFTGPRGTPTTGSGYMGGASTGGFAGAQPEAFGIYSFATGCGSAATGNYSTVFGAGATAKAGGAQAFGVSALASGRASVAIGVDSEASGLSTVAIGGLATALGKNSVAMGTKARAEKNYAIAIGSEAEAQASGSIAIGSRDSDRTPEANRKVMAKAENAIAIGTHTYAEAEDSVAIGANAQVTVYDGVAIGGGSLSDRAKGTVGYDPYINGSSTDDGIAWKSTAGAFSVGEVGGRDNGTLTRQITGVAAGSQDTDAVNVAQLRAMRDVIAGGGGWKISANDKDATDVTSGSTVDFSVTYESEEGKDNLTIVKQSENSKHKVKFSLSDNLKLTSVTTGEASMSDDGFVIQNGPKITADGFIFDKGASITINGVDAGSKSIFNVADATEDDEAVTYRQLKEVQKGIKTSWQLSVNGGDAMSIGPNEMVNLEAVSKNNKQNIKIAKGEDHNVQFDLADDINVTSVTTGNSIMNGEGFKFVDGNGPSITVNGINAGNQKITGVLAGTEDTDAVNYKQLQDFTAGIKTGWKLSVDGNNATDVQAGSTVDLVAGETRGGKGKNITIQKDRDNKVTFALKDEIHLATVTTGKSIMSSSGFMFIDGGPSMTLQGINADDKKITKVAKGTEDTDAVNFAQLNEIKNEMAGNSLVQWDEEQKLITIGAQKGGTKIDITGTEGERTIAGVKNGTISEDSKEAVNGSQINKISGDIAKFFGGNAAFENGDFKGPKYSLSTIVEDGQVTKTNYYNVGDALTGLDANVKSVNNRLTNVSNEFNQKIEGISKDALLWSEDEQAFVALHEKDGKQIDYRITHILDGDVNEESTDAINGSQLYSMGSRIAKHFGGNASFENGVFTGPTYELTTIAEDDTVSIENYTDVGKALDVVNKNVFAVDHRITVGFLDIADYFGGGAKYEKGKWHAPTFKVSQRDADGNIVKKEHHNVADALEGVNTSITDIYSQINNVTENSLVKWDEGQKLITIGAQKGGTKIDITGTEGERTIAGVKNGKISAVSKEAINGSQINNISGDIAKFFGGNAAFQDGAFVGPRYNLSIVSADGTVKQEEYTDVGSALTGLDANVKNVNSRLTYVTNEFNQKFDDFSKDALLWSEGEQAFVALHGPNGEKTESKITYLLDGDISEDSTDAINGSQLYNMGDKIANYFGGGASYEDGEWSGPIFKISQREANGTIVEKKYNNVADAFSGVDNSITDIYSQINNVTENSLVKQEGGSEGLITVGKATGGTKISIANKNNEDRTLSGVKDGTLSIISTEAVNGSQLFTTNQNVKAVTSDLKTVAENTSKYFGGSTDVLAGIEPTFLIQDKTYHNVTEAFAGVNVSINNIDNKISDLEKNNLVQQEGGASGVITIGAKTAGTKISVASIGGAGRTIAGVKAAEKGDEAVNKDQLDKSIEKISNDIEIASAAAVLYDKDANGGINYNSVTLGGEKTDGPVALLNVKDGRIAEESYDAINGSQINEISGDIANYFGGDASFENGAFVGPKYSLSTIVENGQVAKTNYYNVGDALTGLDANVKSVNNRLTNVSNEFNQKIEGISKDALLWNDEEQAFVALHEKDGKKTKSKLKYLLDGEIAKDSTDAITGNQLYLMSNQLANYFGGGAKYENGQWTAPTFRIAQVNADGTVGEKIHNNVADAFGGISNGMVNINDRIDDIINKVDSDVLHWNKDKGAYDASHDGQPSKIINVADGRIAEGSKDAVNGGQLWKTNERVTSVEKDVKHLNNRVDNIYNTIDDISNVVINIGGKVENINNRVDNIEKDAVRYDRDANGKKVNKVTLIGGNESEPVTIDNVADGKIGTGSKEAVNGGQLHDYTQEQMKIVLDESKHYTDQRINNIRIDAIDDAVERANNYTNMKFEALNYSIENVRKEAKQAAAIGLAVSNLRYNDTPGKLSVAFGSGLWRGQSAFALGAGYSSEDGKIRSNLSATSSGGHWGVGLGLNLTLN
ncbi:Vomp family autotransporter [Bartonella taylorii]|uniref:Vomp family autotransporter n=1 Tax=Bartonella taylorii TaxID=33046 RepID=A0A9Q8YYC8_BARTA|nr:Vomp family autotransporter [Bartonella taylorii]USP02595.1 Vomp family autotransporter [Bartonella taylorii]